MESILEGKKLFETATGGAISGGEIELRSSCRWRHLGRASKTPMLPWIAPSLDDHLNCIIAMNGSYMEGEKFFVSSTGGAIAVGAR